MPQPAKRKKKGTSSRKEAAAPQKPAEKSGPEKRPDKRKRSSRSAPQPEPASEPESGPETGTETGPETEAESEVETGVTFLDEVEAPLAMSSFLESGTKGDENLLRAVAKFMSRDFERYSGEDGRQLHEYLDNIEIIAQSQGLTQTGTIALARQFTSGVARAWARRATSFSSWEKFRNAFCQRFSVQTDLQRAAGILAELAQNRQQPVRKTVNNLQTACDLLETLRCRIPDQLQIALLCEGLPRALADDIRAKGFTDAQDAIQFAAQRGMTGDGGATRHHERERTPHHQRQHDDRERRSGGRDYRRGRPAQERATPNAGTPPQATEAKGATDRPPRACFTCGSESHLARECPKRHGAAGKG